MKRVKIIGKEGIYKVHSHTTIKDKDNPSVVISDYFILTDVNGKNLKEEFKSSQLEEITVEYTPENITKLKPNEVFVFGSNTEGRHGAGAAKAALDKFGAIYGKAEGLQGQSYGLITTDLDPQSPKYPLEFIYQNIIKFIEFAKVHPELKFYTTKVGSNLAGYTISEIRDQFIRCSNYMVIPMNIILPKEFEMRF